MNIFQSIAQIINPIYAKGDRPLIIDLSHYNNKDMTQADMDALYAAGVRMVVHKCSDGYQLVYPDGDPTKGNFDHSNYIDNQFAKRCDLAYHCSPHRMLFGGYHFFEPGPFQAGANDPGNDFQFQTMRQALIVNGTMRKVDLLALDLEDHRNLNGGNETPTNIADRSRHFWEWMQADPNMKTVRQLPYTRYTYLQDWSPPMIEWLGRKDNPFDLWMALGAWDHETWTWDTLKWPNPDKEIQAPGDARCVMRQYALDISGLDHVGGGSIDLNIWQGSTQSFYNYFGVANPETVSVPVVTPAPVDPAPIVVPPVLPSPEPSTALTVTLADTMNIRTGPGTTYDKTGNILAAGTVISIISISIQPSSVWIEFSPKLWVCAQLNGVKFIK